MADNLVEKHFPDDQWISELHTAELVKQCSGSSFGVVPVLARRLAETHDLLQETHDKLWQMYRISVDALGCVGEGGARDMTAVDAVHRVALMLEQSERENARLRDRVKELEDFVVAEGECHISHDEIERLREAVQWAFARIDAGDCSYDVNEYRKMKIRAGLKRDGGH